MNGLLYLIGFVLLCSGIGASSLLGLWLCVEMASFVVIPCFFSYGGFQNRYISLVVYLLMSGIGAGLFFMGLLSTSMEYLLFLSFALKVGIFPMTSWIYNLYSGLSWGFLFYISVASKVVFLVIPPLAQSGILSVFTPLVWLTLVFSTMFLWGDSIGIKGYLVYSSVSSGALLFYLCISGLVSHSVSIWWAYMFFSAISFCGLFHLERVCLSQSKASALFFAFLSFPCSFGICYKACVLSVLAECTPEMQLIWLMMTVTETVYFVSFMVELSSFFGDK